MGEYTLIVYRNNIGTVVYSSADPNFIEEEGEATIRAANLKDAIHRYGGMVVGAVGPMGNKHYFRN